MSAPSNLLPATMRATSSLLLTVLALTLSIGSASAQDPSATVLFRRGAAAYGSERYEEAAHLFEQAYALSHESTMLYNLALARHRFGDVPGAIESYRAFLAAVPDAPERTEIETSLMTLERMEVTQEEPEVLTPPPVVERIVTVEPPPPGVPVTPGREVSPAPFVILGTGLVGLGVAGVLSWLAADVHGRAVTEPVQRLAAERARESGDFALGANITWGVAGGLALVGAIWAIVELTSSGPSEQAVSLSIGPTGARVSGVF